VVMVTTFKKTSISPFYRRLFGGEVIFARVEFSSCPHMSWVTWQTDTDIPDRRLIVFQILKIMQKRKPDLPMDSRKRELIPDLVRRLEEALYRSAMNKEEYKDAATLWERLQTVARKMASISPRAPMESATQEGTSAGGESSKKEPSKKLCLDMQLP
jgi:hypothetical protein